MLYCIMEYAVITILNMILSTILLFYDFVGIFLALVIIYTNDK